MRVLIVRAGGLSARRSRPGLPRRFAFGFPAFAAVVAIFWRMIAKPARWSPTAAFA